MGMYRKRPVVIEAVQWTGSIDEEMFDLLVGCSITLNSDKTVSIVTLEGTIKVSVGDWIIKGVSGEIYPCKLDIFDKAYERVDNWRKAN